MVVLSQDDNERMISILKKIEQNINLDVNHLDSLIYSYFVHITYLINAAFTKSNPITIYKMTPVLNQAIKFISENYLTINDINEISDHCYISTSYLCRIFKNMMHISPNEYIINLKITRAKYLLKNGRNVTEACYESGFNNYTYFISSFKKYTGLTPLQYKKTD